MPADLLAEYEAPAQVQPKAPDLMAEFDPPPRKEQHAVINDAADKAHQWKTADATGRLKLLIDGFGDHFTEETKKTITQNWEAANKPLLELPQIGEVPDVNVPAAGNLQILAGAYNGAAKVASGLTSPLSIGTLGTFGALTKVASGFGPAADAAKVGLRVIQGAFAAQMAKGAGEAAGAASVTSGKSTQEETSDVVGALASSAMTVLAAKSASETPEPSVKGEATNPNAVEEAMLRKTDENLAKADATLKSDVEPVNIGPRDETVSTGNGVPTAKEEVMLAEQKRMVDEHLAKTNLAEEFTPPAPGTEEHAVITEELAQQPESVSQPEPEVRELPTVPPPEGITGIRNAIVDQERESRGLPPAMEAAKKEFGESWTAASKKIEENPNAGIDLVTELRDKPRPLTDEENAILLHRQIDLQNQFDKVNDRIVNGSENASPEQRASDQVQQARLLDDLLDVYNVGKRVGTEQGRGLAARKMLANEDFSLAKMIVARRAVNEGRPLTPKQADEVQALHDKIAATQKAFDDYRASNKPRAGTSNRDKNIVSTFIDKQADLARQRIRERLTGARTSGSVLGADLLADYAIIGAQHIKNGVEAFAEWSKKMTDEFGEKLKPHLQSIFDQATITADDALLNARIEARRQRLEETIKELDRKIKEGDLSTEPEKASRPSVEEIEVLEQQRDKLRDDLNAMRETDRKINELQEAIDEKERKIKEGDLSAKPSAANRPSAPEIEKLKQERDALNKDLADARKEERKPDDTELQARKLEELNRRITKKKDALKSGNVAAPRKELNRPQTQELEEARQELESLNKQLADRRAKEPTVGGIKKTAEEIRLQSFKTRAANRAKEYEARLAGKEKAQPAPLKLDPEAERLKAAADRAKGEFQAALIEDRLANRTSFEKAQDTFVKWRRGFLLSGPATLGKLTGAAVLRMGQTPIEELIGSGISRVAPGLAEKAPREGAGNIEAEAAALSGAFFRGMTDAAQTIKTGHSDLDVLYGKGRDGNVREQDIAPRSVIDFFGSLHGALKAPVKRAEFERSFEKRIAYLIREGVDVTDPMIQTKVAVDAYKDANRAIFMQDNVVTDAWNAGIARLTKADKQGNVSTAGKVAATTLRTLLPIVKVPTNIVAETFEMATGSVTGSVKLAKAIKNGTEKLTPEQADIIMRQLKKGSLGLALLALGIFSPENAGGLYQPGEKRKPTDVKVGGLRLFGTDIPAILIHNPAVEVIQLGATIRRVADSKFHGKDKGWVTGVESAIAGLIEEIPFFRTPIELGKLIPENSRTKAEGDLARSFVVPEAVQFAARKLDKDAAGNEIHRNPKTVLENVKTGIPILREDVRRK